ncbi:hypothetical protein MP228_007720 [Amoeboaphelidium protococcarum]|nr:hypothetical protein MP228_007720 [Amoeboaphelidium protococcarum]
MFLFSSKPKAQVPEIVQQAASTEELNKTKQDQDLDMERSASESSLDSTSSNEDAVEAGDGKPKQIKQEFPIQYLEEEILKSIVDGDSDRFHALAQKCKSSLLLQAILAYSHQNNQPKEDLSLSSFAAQQQQSKQGQSQLQRSSSKDEDRHAKTQRRLSLSPTKSNTQNLLPSGGGQTAASGASGSGLTGNWRHSFIMPDVQYFSFDQDLQEIGAQLLGTSLSPLSFLHIALITGEQQVSLDILEFVYKHTAKRGQKLLLMEFLNRVWGDGNSALHLASFQGMSDVVDRLLKCGANPHKKNDRGYRPVDCADDDQTRKLFRVAIEMMRLSGNESALKRQGSIMTRTGGHSQPVVERKESAPAVVQNTAKTLSIAGGKVLDRIKESDVALDADSPSMDNYRRSQSTPAIPVSQVAQKSPQGLSQQDVSTEQSSGGKKQTGKKRKSLNWNQNALLLDYSKNGEYEQVEKLLKQFTVVKQNYGSSVMDGLQFEQNHNKIDDKLYINRPNGQGLTALHYACAYGHSNICDLLLSHGALPNAKDREGFTPLHALVTEVPLQISPTADKSKIAPSVLAKSERRPQFLALLKRMVAMDVINLAALTEDGDCVLDLVREDVDGNIDSEVADILEQAAKVRGIDFDNLSISNSEINSPSASSNKGSQTLNNNQSTSAHAASKQMSPIVELKVSPLLQAAEGLPASLGKEQLVGRQTTQRDQSNVMKDSFNKFGTSAQEGIKLTLPRKESAPAVSQSYSSSHVSQHGNAANVQAQKNAGGINAQMKSSAQVQISAQQDSNATLDKLAAADSSQSKAQGIVKSAATDSAPAATQFANSTSLSRNGTTGGRGPGRFTTKMIFDAPYSASKK